MSPSSSSQNPEKPPRTPGEFMSEKYRAVISDDGLLTVRNGPPVLRETTFLPDGGVDVKFLTQEDAPTKGVRDLLAYKARSPVFVACWAGNRQWNVDIDCGMQRFNGVKSNGELVKALKNCGFSKTQIDSMLKECKTSKKWDYCPHHY